MTDTRDNPYLDILFDGPPDREGGRFVEINCASAWVQEANRHRNLLIYLDRGDQCFDADPQCG